MADRLKDKVALITGAARGMGAAAARIFAAAGARVIVSDVLESEGAAVAQEIGERATFAYLDVTQRAEWESAVEVALTSFGGLDILVNNAAVVRFVPLAQTSLDEYRLVTETNQTGTFLGMQAVYPRMCDAGGGSIINISSVDGLQGSPGLAAYAASKFAVRGLSKVAALEWARDGIRVNSIHPGATRTPMAWSIPGMSEAQLEGVVASSVPLGRMADPEEIARLALFLASDESSYCTGAEFVIDGGATCGTLGAVLEAAHL